MGMFCVHFVFRRTIIWVVRVTLSKSSMSSYPTSSAPSTYQIAKNTNVCTILRLPSSFFEDTSCTHIRCDQITLPVTILILVNHFISADQNSYFFKQCRP